MICIFISDEVIICAQKMSMLSTIAHILHFDHETQQCSIIDPMRTLLARQLLVLELGGLRRHGQNAERIRVTETALPALHSNDGTTLGNDVELESVGEAEPDAVVDLRRHQHRARFLRCTRPLTSVCHWWLWMPRGSG
jgi:hypothetical protein